MPEEQRKVVVSTFDCEDFPREERFDRWRNWTADTYAAMSIRSDHSADFEFHQSHLALGPVVVWPTEVPTMELNWTSAQARALDSDVYHIGLVRRGTCTTDWGDRQTIHLPGQLQFNGSSRPFATRYAHDGGLYKSIGIKVPHSAISLPQTLVARAMAAEISYREGVGAVLDGFVTHLAATAGSLTPADAARLGGVLADLVSAVLAHALEADTALLPEARRRSLLLRAQRFLLDNLHDPDLGPHDAAAHLHISVRHLHQLFQPTGTTAAAWIRARRLERAHRDLADPALAGLPIGAIARRWGYAHHTAFSRAFRAAHGISPTDHRHESRPRSS
ncbi:AraC family transcriptional regulator [Nocardiopsis sediminis]|uniref:AraC family transcriptional regulator n=1 Tax=Nocardiopsis sediminis TaxID=1778267 RepID=A0ABV8FJP4_9ACTN